MFSPTSNLDFHIFYLRKGTPTLLNWPKNWLNQIFFSTKSLSIAFIIISTVPIVLLKIFKGFWEFNIVIQMHLEGFWYILDKYFGTFEKTVVITCKFLLKSCLTPWRNFSRTKILLRCPKCSEINSNCVFNSKRTINIFTTYLYDLIWVLNINMKIQNFVLRKCQIWIQHIPCMGEITFFSLQVKEKIDFRKNM